MSIQFLGMIGHRLSSETIAPVGPIFDRDYIVRFAQTHEAAGFDRLLVGHWSDQPDGFLVTATWRDCRRRKFSTCWPIVPVLFPQPLPRANSLPLSTCWGPLGGAYHQRRQRCRAAPGWRLSRPRPALRPHRRLPRHRAPGVDQRAAGGYSQRFLSGRAGLVRHSPAAKAASSHLLRRLVGSGHRRRRQTCRRLRAVGRVAGANRRDHPAGARRSGETPA